MNRFRSLAKFFPFPALILVSALFHGCNTTDNESGTPAGAWESEFTRINPENGFPDEILVMLILDENMKSSFDTYWNGLFDKGFVGGWSYKGDSLFLTATKCFKGDSTGTQSINDCGEDMPNRLLTMFWDGENISYGEGAARIRFQRKAN